MWSNGKRTALDIYRMLSDWGAAISPKLYMEVLMFLEKESYLKTHAAMSQLLSVK